MDEKNREKGMDYEFLQKQIEEKKAREAAEAEEEKDYQRRFLEEQRLLGRLAREEKRVRAEIQREDNEFNMTHMTRENSREYDITRPDYKKVQLPVRTGDDDAWLTVSSGQKFEGEDLGAQERQKRQREQLHRWHTQQMAEKENRKVLELEEDREWQRRYLENDKLMNQIEEQTKLARKEVQSRIDEENYRAMMEKRRQIEEEKFDELCSNEAEKAATNNSRFMTESRDQAIGLNGKRIVQDWKGMTDEEKLQIIEDRRTQMMENQRKRQEEAMRERQEEAERQRIARDAIKRERAEMRERKQKEKDLADQYLRDAQEEKRKEQERNRNLYGTNQPTEDFWSYFGKSHR